jgi:uncharacterized protein YjiS (DUF1127 family)
MGHASHCTGSEIANEPRIRPGFTAAVAWVMRAMRTRRERQSLIGLDECALKDIGLSRADAYGEWSRPFWDLPAGN